MKKIQKLMGVVLMLALFGVGFVLEAQTKRGDWRTMNTIKRLETQTDRFRRSLDAALDMSKLDGTDLEDDFMARVDALEIAADRLRDRAEDNEIIVSDVENVLSRGLTIEMQMRAHRTSPRAMRDWMAVRNTLDRLASAHRVAWVWTVNQNPYWRTASQRRVFDRLENRSDEFRMSFDDALDASRLDGTELEDNAVELVKSFEESVDRLEDRVSRGERLSASDVELLLGSAITIDNFMKKHALSPRAERDWAQVKANLEELAMINNVIWRWTVEPIVPFGVRQ